MSTTVNFKVPSNGVFTRFSLSADNPSDLLVLLQARLVELNLPSDSLAYLDSDGDACLLSTADELEAAIEHYGDSGICLVPGDRPSRRRSSSRNKRDRSSSTSSSSSSSSSSSDSEDDKKKKGAKKMKKCHKKMMKKMLRRHHPFGHRHGHYDHPHKMHMMKRHGCPSPPPLSGLGFEHEPFGRMGHGPFGHRHGHHEHPHRMLKMMKGHGCPPPPPPFGAGFEHGPFGRMGHGPFHRMEHGPFGRMELGPFGGNRGMCSRFGMEAPFGRSRCEGRGMGFKHFGHHGFGRKGGFHHKLYAHFEGFGGPRHRRFSEGDFI